MKKLALLLALLLSGAAQAQTNFDMPPPAGVMVGGFQVVSSCGSGSLNTTKPAFGTMDTTGKFCVAATVSASVTGFAPGGAFATLTASATSGSVALPTGAVVLFQNVGTTAVSCTLGIGSATAVASETIVQPASTVALTVGSNTFGACIDQTGSASNLVVLSGGAGIATGWGGGTSGGGGGGSVTQGTVPWVVSGAAGATLGLDSSLQSILSAVQGSIPAGTATIGTVGQLPYPVGATPLTASATGTTAATTATLAGTSGKTTYICSYSIRANATAATTVTNTVTGVITATMSHIMWIAPAASGLGIDEQIFSPCIPASGTNQAIAVVSGAPGSGGLVSATAAGYQL